ncbi:MAG: hypothetical protein K2M88_00420 [Muribaculaceae bacterium]|nr:hypothetical protein [Muribaculaceae bacterium]
MARTIHISTARTMLNSGDPIGISVWKSDGSILHLRNCISLIYNFYRGWRNIKMLSSGERRKIRDCVSSQSMTAKFSFDNSRIICNFAE